MKKQNSTIVIRIPMRLDAKIEEMVSGPVFDNKSQFIREAIIEKIKKLEENFNDGDDIY